MVGHSKYNSDQLVRFLEYVKIIPSEESIMLNRCKLKWIVEVRLQRLTYSMFVLCYVSMSKGFRKPENDRPKEYDPRCYLTRNWSHFPFQICPHPPSRAIGYHICQIIFCLQRIDKHARRVGFTPWSFPKLHHTRIIFINKTQIK